MKIKIIFSCLLIFLISFLNSKAQGDNPPVLIENIGADKHAICKNSDETVTITMPGIPIPFDHTDSWNSDICMYVCSSVNSKDPRIEGPNIISHTIAPSFGCDFEYPDYDLICKVKPTETSTYTIFFESSITIPAVNSNICGVNYDEDVTRWSHYGEITIEVYDPPIPTLTTDSTTVVINEELTVYANCTSSDDLFFPYQLLFKYPQQEIAEQDYQSNTTFCDGTPITFYDMAPDSIDNLTYQAQSYAHTDGGLCKSDWASITIQMKCPPESSISGDTCIIEEPPTCPPANEDLNFTTQEELDKFITNQCLNCEEINGNVTITGTVNDLSKFCVKRINGSLSISSSDLINLNGLENLTYIKDDFTIFFHLGALNIDALTSLQYIGGNLDISSNLNLNVDAFTLRKLKEVGGAITIIDNVSFEDNEVLGVLNLRTLESVGKSITISDNDVFKEIRDFAFLNSIGENNNSNGEDAISINGNAKLEFVGDFRANEINGNISITNNKDLEEIGDFNRINELSGSISITDNSALEEIGDFFFLKKIHGNLAIKNNPSLNDIGTFHFLAEINGKMDIINTAISSLPRFNSLDTIQNSVVITNNSNFNDCESLCRLVKIKTDVTLGGNLDCNLLEQIRDDCKPGSTYISIIIKNCVENLTINQILFEQDTFSVKGIIESELVIPSNDTIVFKAGEHITLLPGFHAQAGSEFTAIIEECVTEVFSPVLPIVKEENIAYKEVDTTPSNRISIYPNPFNTTLIIQHPFTHASKVVLSLYDLHGKMIKEEVNYNTGHKGQVIWKDVVRYEGIYFLVARTDEEVQTIKLVKK